jgi:uncharacterized protein YggT (Ycf19 family)
VFCAYIFIYTCFCMHLGCSNKSRKINPAQDNGRFLIVYFRACAQWRDDRFTNRWDEFLGEPSVRKITLLTTCIFTLKVTEVSRIFLVSCLSVWNSVLINVRIAKMCLLIFMKNKVMGNIIWVSPDLCDG